MTLLMALGRLLAGSWASPAAVPMEMMPPKEKITATREKSMPAEPLGKKPPCSVMLLKPKAGSGVRPKTMAAPTTIMRMSATTLMRESQNSASAKAPTCTKLMAVTMTSATRAVSQCGIPGNQKSMMVPAAVSSTMPTTMVVNHQFQPVTKPAMGPMYSRA